MLVRLLIEWSQVRVLLGEPKLPPRRTKLGTPPINRPALGGRHLAISPRLRPISAHPGRSADEVGVQKVDAISPRLDVGHGWTAVRPIQVDRMIGPTQRIEP